MSDDLIALQRQYYGKNAGQYPHLHMSSADEHYFALWWLLGLLDCFSVQSVLDVGSGTGRAVTFIKERMPSIRVLGVEPVAELRKVGYSSGLPLDSLVDGDATRLNFDDESFDIVCAFGMLHHVRNPEIVIDEMLRVSKVGIFISDSNNIGQGRCGTRVAKLLLSKLGLWPFVNFVKTRGKGYNYSEGDGISYSYSVFNNYGRIRSACSRVHIMNTRGQGQFSVLNADHVALVGLKKLIDK